MKRFMCLVLCVIICFSSCTSGENADSSYPEAENPPMINQEDNNTRKQIFIWNGTQYALQYKIGIGGIPLITTPDAILITIGEEKWLRCTIQSEDGESKASAVLYYLLWDPNVLEFKDIFSGSGLFEFAREHSLTMVDKSSDNKQFVFRDLDTRELYYSNLTEGTLYSLNEVTGEDVVGAVLYYAGVFCITGMSGPDEEEIAAGGDVCFTIRQNYGDCGVIREQDAGGGKRLKILGFGAQDLGEGKLTLRLRRRLGSSYEELPEQYDTWVQLSVYSKEYWTDLIILPQIDGMEIPFSETGGPRVNAEDTYTPDGLEGTYTNILDNVYEEKGYGEVASVYKKTDGGWERLPDLEYIDTFTLDNGENYDVDYLLAVDGDYVLQVTYNHDVDQVSHVRMLILNGHCFLKFRPWITVEADDYKVMPQGFNKTEDGKYRRLIEGYFLEWNPETGRFEDIFAGSGLWEYACAGRISLEKISEDGQYFLFDIRVPAQTDEEEISDKYILERGGKLVPAQDSSMEAWLALDYNYSGH